MNIKFVVVAIILLLPLSMADDCSNFNGQDACNGQQVDQPPSFDLRRWQSPDYQLVAYAQVVYADTTLQAADIHIWALERDNTSTLMYQFGNEAPSKSPDYHVDASTTTDQLPVKITSSSGSSLTLDPIDFAFLHPKIASSYDGKKGAIVEMMGWPYADIEKECPDLAKMGYLGVKVFPPQESVFSFEWPLNGELNPWFYIYQPVSYRLNGRWGTAAELGKMIDACRSVGVRVYADAVINHMTGSGNDIQDHRNSNGGSCDYWSGKNSTAPAGEQSPYYTESFCYKNNTESGLHPTQEFPAVPYGPRDFHCNRPLNSWSSPFDLNYGWLVGLVDLNGEQPYVRQRIADYITALISFGFSGIRVDAAKHQSPDNLAAIFAIVKDNLGGALPSDFYAYLEVLVGGEKDLLCCQYSDYNYYEYFNDAMKKQGMSDDDIDKILIWSSDYPKEFPACGSWVIPATRFAVQNDDWDQQSPGSSSRDMGDKGSVLLHDKDVDKHRGFEEQLFSRTDGDWNIKLVLSGYTFMDNGAAGVPDGMSDCSKCIGPHCTDCSKSVPYSAAYDPNSCGYDCVEGGQWKEGVYTRVHRDKGIISAMRQWMGLSTDISNEELGLADQC